MGLACNSRIEVAVISVSEGSPAGSLARSASYCMCEGSNKPSTGPVLAASIASNWALFQM